MAQILVVDDDKEVNETISMFLEGKGHKVACLESAKIGLEWAMGHEVDLLITDILMPDMNGLELIEAVKELKPETKVLAITGGGKTGGIVKNISLLQAKELGASQTLPKPFTEEELVRKVNNLLKD